MKIVALHLKKYMFVCLMIAGMLAPAVIPSVAYAAASCPPDQQRISVTIDPAQTTCVPISARGTLDQNPIFFYVRYLVIFIGGGIGIAVVGGITAGSYMYITARGNSAQAQKGQDTITNSVIGLLLFIFMYTILQFLIPGGIFQ